MNFLARLDPGDTLTRLALGALLQVTVVIVAAALAGVGLRRRAAVRHTLWVGALAWVLLSPAVVVLSERSRVRLGSVALPFLAPRAMVIVERTAHARPSFPSPVVATESSLDVATTGPVAAADSRASRLRVPNRGPWREAIGGGLSVVWALGVLIGLSRIATGGWRLTALARRLRPIDAARHGATLEQARVVLGAALPPIMTSPAVAGPVAAGLLRPRVVLPEGLAEALTTRALRDVLVHECAHVLRRDSWVGLLQRLAVALYWPHPLVYYLSGQLARAREEVCDNHVLGGRDARGYARTLLALTEQCRPLGAMRGAGIGLLGGRWTLAERVEGLLDPGRVDRTRTHLATRLALAAALAALGPVVASVRLDGPARAEEPGKNAAAEAPTPGSVRKTGIVVDEEGRPVAGALIRRSGDQSIQSRSAADGTFTLTFDRSPLTPPARVFAEVDGGARIGLIPFNEAPARDPLRIVVKPTRPLTVSVHDAVGAPVAGAAVEAIEPLVFHADARTGPDGNARLRIPADARVPCVIGFKAGLGFDYFENERRRPQSTYPPFDYPPLPAEVSLRLDGAQTLRIKAIDSHEQPIAGVVLDPGRLLKPGKADSADLRSAATIRVTTDGAGVALFDWLPKGLRRVSLAVRSETHFCPNPPRLDLPASGPAESIVRLLRKTRVSGTARFPDGQPAPGVRIRAEGYGPARASGPMIGLTGGDGAYSLEVPPEQSYLLAVVDEQWAAPSHTGVVVRENQPLAGLDFALTAGTLLHGRVTEGPDRKPRLNQWVRLTEQGRVLPRDLRGGQGQEEMSRFAFTDAEGRYRFRVGPGRYQLAGWSPDGAEPTTVEVKGEPEIIRDIAMKGTTNPGFLSGVVREQTTTGERPLASAAIFALEVGAGLIERTQTDSEGRFRLVRPPVDLILYTHGRDLPRAAFVVVPDDADNLSVLVTDATSIYGRVVDTSGKGLPGRHVFLRLDSGADYASSGHFRLVLTTDAEGRFRYSGAPVRSEGELYVRHRDDNVLGPRTAVSFNIVELKPVEVPDLVVPASEPAKEGGAAGCALSSGLRGRAFAVKHPRLPATEPGVPRGSERQ